MIEFKLKKQQTHLGALAGLARGERGLSALGALASLGGLDLGGWNDGSF